MLFRSRDRQADLKVPNLKIDHDRAPSCGVLGQGLFPDNLHRRVQNLGNHRYAQQGLILAGQGLPGEQEKSQKDQRAAVFPGAPPCRVDTLSNCPSPLS